MDLQARLDALRKESAEAARRYDARQQVRSSDTGPPQPGDIFLLDGPATIDVRWVIVLRHPELNSLYVVPADAHPLAGLSDVIVPPSVRGGPLVLRCGFGLWLSPEDFRTELRLDHLDEPFLSQARDKLEAIVQGGLKGSALGREDESSHEYDDWLEEVAGAVRAAEDVFRRPVLEFGREHFVNLPAPIVDVDPAALQVAMAALGEGLPQRLFAALADRTGPSPPICSLPFAWPGEFLLVLEEEGVAVLYRPVQDAVPPLLNAVEDGTERLFTWQTSPRGKTHRALLPWRDGRVLLRLGSGNRIKEVTVRR